MFQVARTGRGTAGKGRSFLLALAVCLAGRTALHSQIADEILAFLARVQPSR
ncbi:hypothetical protein [Labrys okinawensis]|uniref:hypothetical protein n=1 Tax=Labrys okinawensis TaxID=346911 RepID=UPI0015E3AB3E|nr:hypothetical protein [Labrys okinawensis]